MLWTGYLYIHFRSMNKVLLNIDWSFLQRQVAGNTVTDYIWFFLLVVVAFFLMKPLVYTVFRTCAALFRRWFPDASERPVLREMTANPVQRLLQCILLYAAVHRLDQPFNLMLINRKSFNIRLIEVIDHLFIFCIIIFTTLLISRGIDFIFHQQYKKAGAEGDADRLRILPLLRDVIKLLIWATCAFMVLGIVFHVNVPALITGLGIGGIAIALAGKETVENLFASFTILADKPFHTGDSIKLGNFEGVITKVGFRSTRLRSPDGTLLVIPNKKLIDENLENLTIRKTHRIRTPVLIKYGLAPDVLAEMTRQIRKTLRENDQVVRPVETTVEAFGENTLQLMITYHLPNPVRRGSLQEVREQITLQLFGIINQYAIIPAAPGVTSIRILDNGNQQKKKDGDEDQSINMVSP